MTCDGDCKGKITIGDGYAIDCCGNDLVVCEPRTYDVIAELRRKKWLLEIPKERWPPGRSAAGARSGYGLSGPAVLLRGHLLHGGAGRVCNALFDRPAPPGPAPCQPTRIREGVRFELYDKLPHRPNPLEEIEKRIERCFRVFRDSQFSRGLTLLAPRILELLDCGRDVDKAWQEERSSTVPRQVFAELRALFLHELRICPDPYNCDLERRVYALRPPDDQGEGVLEAFTRLLELVGTARFQLCPGRVRVPVSGASEACCVVIGAVEVENGKLTRVINYPRWYLWSFANFFEVLIYTLATDAACGEKNELRTADQARAADIRRLLSQRRGGRVRVPESVPGGEPRR